MNKQQRDQVLAWQAEYSSHLQVVQKAKTASGQDEKREEKQVQAGSSQVHVRA
jgi:hypothetical protein